MNQDDLAALYMLRIFQGAAFLYFLLFASAWLELTLKSRKHDIRVFGTTNPWSFAWKYYWNGQKQHAIFGFIVFSWTVILQIAYF